MWMPHHMKMLNLEEKGLEMSADDLYKADGTGLMSAVVDLGGGTGSFVSSKGLIFTNHHVAFGALQRASDPEHNYLKNGFLANNFNEEIKALGYTAGVLISYREVTKEIHTELKDDMTARERYDAIDLAEKKLVKEAEENGPDIFAETASMYAGNKYYIFIYKRIKDIRIVYAPPGDLGNYGGETDNWMWPRHTCDFTFLRAYVSPGGDGAEYSPDNVPYEPKVHFKIAEKGVKENDFTFIMGYPGKTYRNYSAPELIFDIDKLKKSIEDRLEYIAFFERAGKNNEALEIKYAGMLKGLYNGLKNYRGKLEGFKNAGLVNLKKGLDEDFNKWAQKEEGRSKTYSGIVSKIGAFLEAEYKDLYWLEYRLKDLTYYRGPALLTQAHRLVRISIEHQKPDMERDASYQDRNMYKLTQRMKLAERGYEINVDKDYTILRLNKLIKESKGHIPDFLNAIADTKGCTSKWLSDTFKKTNVHDLKFRLGLIGKTPEELKALNDPLLDLAFNLEKELGALRDKKDVLGQKLHDFKKIYLHGMLAIRNNHMAPDANSTIRFTYGNVEGYSPRDGMYYKPITTIKGVIEKDTGKKPFHAPEKFKKLYKEKDFGSYIDTELGSVPACFLNITNVTGGNSGSPVINARGEVTGIVFDMTYESVIGDYYIIPEMQRVINVDMRYVLFVTDKFSGAEHLIKEMGIK